MGYHASTAGAESSGQRAAKEGYQCRHSSLAWVKPKGQYRLRVDGEGCSRQGGNHSFQYPDCDTVLCESCKNKSIFPGAGMSSVDRVDVGIPSLVRRCPNGSRDSSGNGEPASSILSTIQCADPSIIGILSASCMTSCTGGAVHRNPGAHCFGDCIEQQARFSSATGARTATLIQRDSRWRPRPEVSSIHPTAQVDALENASESNGRSANVQSG